MHKNPILSVDLKLLWREPFSFKAICYCCFQFHYKTIEWHPDVATQMLIGNEDDRYPVIQVKKQLNPFQHNNAFHVEASRLVEWLVNS